MKYHFRRSIAMLLAIALIFSVLITDKAIAKKKAVKPTITKKVTVTVGKNKTLKINKISAKKIKRTTWKSTTKKIKLSKKKKTSVSLKASSAVKGTITAKLVLKSGKKYTLTCRVTAKKKTSTKPPAATSEPIITPSPSPTPKPTATPYIPKDLPEAKAVEVPAKPEVNASYTNEVSSDSKYDLTKALSATSVKDAYSDYFSMGAAINGTSAAVSTAASPEMRQVMIKHFNSTTLSNLLKPSYLLDQSASQANAAAGNNDLPGLKFNNIVDNLEFCKENGIKMRGHVLVWHVQTPEWFFREGFTNDGAYVDKVTMQKRMGSFIRQVLEFCQKYYPDVIYCWDVVNEAVDTSGPGGYRNSNWYKIIGKGFIADAFYYARKYADPDVKLFYNDYNCFQPSKCSKINSIVKPLKDAGLLDGVGMQSYYVENQTLSQVKTAIEKFAASGLEIQLTELTYRVPDYNNPTEEDYRKQGENYKALMKMLIDLDTASGGPANITNVTFFGLIDNPYSVFGQNPAPDRDCWARLFDENFDMKPSYYGVIAAVEEAKK